MVVLYPDSSSLFGSMMQPSLLCFKVRESLSNRGFDFIHIEQQNRISFGRDQDLSLGKIHTTINIMPLLSQAV